MQFAFREDVGGCCIPVVGRGGFGKFGWDVRGFGDNC